MDKMNVFASSHCLVKAIYFRSSTMPQATVFYSLAQVTKPHTCVMFEKRIGFVFGEIDLGLKHTFKYYFILHEQQNSCMEVFV